VERRKLSLIDTLGETEGAGVDVARTRHSLIPKKSSLFPEIFSLLICVGNFAKSRWGAGGISLSALGSQSLKIGKFPVKFPVSRELAWRRVRSALRRQPGNVRLREFPSSDEKGPPNAGLAENSQKSPAQSKKTPVFWRLALETEE
jgi:hypothetical protein